MASRLRRWLSFPALARSAYSSARLATRLLREPRVPGLLKALPLAGLAYVISPIDFIPDVLPLLGQVDDLTLILMAIEAFKRLSPQPVVAHHEAAIEQGRRYEPMATPPKPGEYIDADFRRD